MGLATLLLVVCSSGVLGFGLGHGSRRTRLSIEPSTDTKLSFHSVSDRPLWVTRSTPAIGLTAIACIDDALVPRNGSLRRGIDYLMVDANARVLFHGVARPSADSGDPVGCAVGDEELMLVPTPGRQDAVRTPEDVSLELS